MFKVKLSRAIDCASKVMVGGYEIDRFRMMDSRQHMECDGVIEFRTPAEQELTIMGDGMALFVGESCECNDNWEPFEGYIEFRVERAMDEHDVL